MIEGKKTTNGAEFYAKLMTVFKTTSEMPSAYFLSRSSHVNSSKKQKMIDPTRLFSLPVALS